MSELEDKLNTILGDPQAMGQIMGAGPVPGRRERTASAGNTAPSPDMGMSPPH